VTYGYEPDTNRLTSLDWDAGGACGRAIGVDEQGRATSYYPKWFAASTDEIGLTFGDSGRLESVDLDNDDLADLFYIYDHRELRVEVVTPAGTRTFTYDQSGRMLSEVESGTNGSVVEYVWLAGLPLAMLLDADGSGAGAAAAYTLGVDHLGTPHRAWEGSAEFAWAADYEAFGKAWEYLPNSTAAPSIEVNLRFPGQYLDRETGLHYNWHRYYSRETGRYLTPDPFESQHPAPLAVNSPMPNSFTYSGNSPFTLTDVTGLWPCKGCDACPCGSWTSRSPTNSYGGFAGVFALETIHLYADCDCSSATFSGTFTCGTFGVGIGGGFSAPLKIFVWGACDGGEVDEQMTGLTAGGGAGRLISGFSISGSGGIDRGSFAIGLSWGLGGGASVGTCKKR
jgi:RHS repeat-associated protein